MSIEIKNTANMKYYLYRSTSKVNMLYQQIAKPSSKKRSFEWRASLKVLSASAKKETEQTTNDHDKLKAVLEAIESSGQLGTIDKPGAYFKGSLKMRWGMFDDWGRPEKESPLVYFGGKTRKTILGLGGSTKHVIGFEGASSTGSRSSTPYIVNHLLKGLGIDSDGWRAYDDDQHALEAVTIATYKLKGPKQNLEFVAKTLLEGESRSSIFTNDKWVHCVLGTPIYVELLPPFPMGL